MRTWILALAICLPTAAQAACVGDCGNDGEVTVDEVLTGVNIALGVSPAGACLSFDGNGDSAVTVDEILTAVSNALVGCDATLATPTPTATATATATATQGNGLATPTAPARPTPADGCGGGYARVTVSQASGTNFYHSPANGSLDLTKGLGTFVVAGQPPYQIITTGGEFVTCPASLGSPVINIRWNLGGLKSVPMTGSSYSLFRGFNIGDPTRPTIAQVDMLEIDPGNPLGTRGWRCDSGTITFDSIEGSTVRLSVDASMSPEPSFSFQTPATGTYRLQFQAIIDSVSQ